MLVPVNAEVGNLNATLATDTHSQGIRDTLSAAAQKGIGTETALLRWHDPEHLEALLRLSMFATSFSTRQAERVLPGHSDVPCVLQVRH